MTPDVTADEAADVRPVDTAAAPEAPAYEPHQGPDPGLDALSEGDLAWWQGDRATAWRAWHRALALASGARLVDRAVEAMARIRLLQVSGTAGPFLHERKLRRAQAACKVIEPWCEIARSDDDLFMPAFTGADPTKVEARLTNSLLPGPAAARVALARGDTTGLAGLPDLDGLGRGIVATGRLRPPDPGTWTVGIGVGGARGAGVGAYLRFVHPDLAWKGHLLEVNAGANSLGGWAVSASATTATRPAWQGTLAGWNEVLYQYDGQGETLTADRYQDLGGRFGAGVVFRPPGNSARFGVSGRIDDLGEGPQAVAGGYASWTTGADRGWVQAAAELQGGSYTHLYLSVDARGYLPLADGLLALRGLGAAAPMPDDPFYRLPSAGGTQLLRGAPAGRHRNDTLVALQAEYRRGLYGPISGAVFVDTARTSTWAFTAGGGLRLILPPERTNVTRIDIGFGPGTWGLVASWGEAF